MDFGKNSLTFQKNLFQYLLYLELGLCFLGNLWKWVWLLLLWSWEWCVI